MLMLNTQSMVGTIFDGRYLLISVVGNGGSSVVFNAYDRKMGCTVAIKMLDLSLAHPSERNALKKQFVDEVRAHSSVSHPAIVGFKGANLKNDPMYFVMEFADGLTLKEYIKRKKSLSQREIIDFSCQILSALSHLHSKNIVHCDIKPHNVIVLQSGKIKLIDLGISRLEGRPSPLPPDKAVGTVYYVSPEQATGKDLDRRSDIYSFGVMLYEMAACQLPFDGDDLDRIAEMHVSAPPLRPRSIDPTVSKGLEQIILKAIAKKPHMRFSNAEEMIGYLEILRKNPRSVFRLQNRNTPQKHSSNYDRLFSATVGACAALVLTFAIAFPIIYNTVMKGTFGDTVSLTTPDLRGLRCNTAVKQLDDRYYDVDIFYVYGTSIIGGTVIAQSPAPNTKTEIDPFNEQCKITLNVSADPAALTMIDIISLTPAEAAEALRREGYTVTVQQRYSDTVTKGLCCGTFPEAGASAEGGSEVILYVSLGYESNS